MIYSLRHLPVRYIPDAYAVVCAVAIALSIVAALYPAWTAAQQNACEGSTI